MIMSSPWLMRLSVAAAGAAFAATVAALDSEDFVAGWPIEAPAGAEVFDVPLTAEVYAAAAGLDQVAVLDANGGPQAFFRRSPPLAEPTEQRVALEASPLYAGGGAAGAPSVGVTTNERGTSVTVQPGAPADATITSFVLDARELDVAPIALELEWRALPQPFLLDVSVEQSADLTAWRNVGRASVAALTIGDAIVRHARVPVRAAAGGYLRVTPSRSVADWYLLRATLVTSSTEHAEPSTVRLMPLAPEARPAEPLTDALYFDAGGMLPVQSVSLAFTDDDGWARADVASSRSLDGPWTMAAHGELFYELSFEGREFESTPLSLGRREARYWRVVPAASPREQTFELTLTFPQEYLRVAVDGGAPYLLAAGTLLEEAGPDATLAAVWARLTPPADVVPFAALGARRELGGAAALVAARPFPWRTAGLWAVLIAGVLVVGAMAVRLAREMRSPPP
jgi:hypothetical protein